MIFRIDLEDRNCFVDIAEKIEQNTAPILRPSKLIKVGQPQPSILLLASKIHEKVFHSYNLSGFHSIFQAKCVERLPVLENELRQVYAEANGRLGTTKIGGQTTDKSFNQV